MSIAGYAIGLGDRHPSNIMIQRHTGREVHIDFGESFDSAALRKKFPEHVPFRMTRMIVSALDGESVEGLFHKSCEDVLWVLRENSSLLVAQLEIFVHEPFFSNRNITGEMVQHTILMRVSAKLSGLHMSEQVYLLMRAAIDHVLYTRHFLGWCPLK
jgi:FKBP12-rapamycin complex-associated protein